MNNFKNLFRSRVCTYTKNLLHKFASLTFPTALLMACVSEQPISVTPPSTTSSAQTSKSDPAITKYIGQWGLTSCLNPAANRNTCEKPHLIVRANGDFTLIEYNSNSGRVKDKIQATVENSGGTLTVLGNGDVKLATLILGHEVGIPVITIKVNAAGSKDLKYISVDNLKEGYQSLEPNEIVRVSKYSAGSNGDEITTSGLCGLPISQVNDAKRRALHTEASKSKSFSYPYQTVSQVVAEYNRTGAQSCKAIGQQFKASMTGYRNAMATADRLNSGTPRAVQCNPSNGSASSASYCAATALLYSAQTVSALCHAVCK